MCRLTPRTLLGLVDVQTNNNPANPEATSYLHVKRPDGLGLRLYQKRNFVGQIFELKSLVCKLPDSCKLFIVKLSQLSRKLFFTILRKNKKNENRQTTMSTIRVYISRGDTIIQRQPKSQCNVPKTSNVLRDLHVDTHKS